MLKFATGALLALLAVPGSASSKVDKYGWPADRKSARSLLRAIETESHSKVVPAPMTESAITGCFIVVMQPGVNSTANANKLMTELESHSWCRSEVGQQYNTLSSLHGFSVCMSPICLRACVADESVEYLEQDRVVKANVVHQKGLAVVQPNPVWSLDRIDQLSINLNSLYTTGDLDGREAHVYVVDTGVNANHTEYASRLMGGADFTNSPLHPPGHDDCNGHGSHCAGTALGSTYGVAKSATLWSVRVLGCDGAGTYSAVIAGVDWSVSNAQAHDASTMSVISMSLGGGASSAMDSAVNSAKSSGMVVVVAAGNEGGDACSFSPARASGVISVAASDISDTRASWSNYGSCVDVFAPGVGITSAWIGSPTAIATISGTSMACPAVAGAAAVDLDFMVSQGVAPTPDAVLTRMKEKATVDAIDDPNGSPNLLLRTPYFNWAEASSIL